MLRMRTLPAGFIEPCLPTKADSLPSGGLWIHEIKHDGFRVIARKDGARVRLYSRPGNDLTDRFHLIVETLANLRTRSCIIDGEAVVCDDNGLAVFDRIRYRRYDGKVFLYAFDLIELDGDDLRREPLDVRKATLRSLLVKVGPGLRWNEHIEGNGEAIFRHACKLGLEGIVSKRKDSPYRSGRSPDWLKMKNPAAPAVSARRKKIGGGTDGDVDPQARFDVTLLRAVARRRLRRAGERRRGRAHFQGAGRAAGSPLGLGERPQRRHQARAGRLRADARGCDGRVRQELAAAIGPQWHFK
jgi:bifunctional non-homologous end joining protein LigD